MKKSEFLDWLKWKLVHSYGESENADFCNNLQRVIDFHKRVEDGRIKLTYMSPAEEAKDDEIHQLTSLDRHSKKWWKPPVSEEVT